MNRSLLAALVLTTSTRLFAQQTIEQRDLSDTVGGAVLDAPVLTVNVPEQIKIFEAAENGRIRALAAGGDAFARAAAFQQLSYYYVPTLTLAHNSAGAPLISVRTRPDGDHVRIKLVPSVAKEHVVAAIRRSNADVRADHVSPIEYRELDISADDAIESYRPKVDSGQPFGEMLIDLRFAPGDGTAFVNAARQGSLDAALKVRYRVLTKLTQNLTGSIKWSTIATTDAYRRFLGPAGANYVTSDQKAAIATRIANDVQFNAWREGTDDAFRVELLKYLRDSLFDSNSRALPFDSMSQLAQFKFTRDAGDFKPDETKKVAIDAKSLDANEWCRKYAYLYKSAASSSSSTSGGGGVSLPIDGIPIGFDADFSTSSSDATSNETNQSSSDCGKQRAERSFNYEWNGQTYVPKSIKVFEILKSKVASSGATSAVDYVVKQRLAWNEYSFVVDASAPAVTTGGSR